MNTRAAYEVLRLKIAKRPVAILLGLVFMVLFSHTGIYSVAVVAAGPTYGDSIKQFGVNTRAYFFATHAICFGPEFAVFARDSRDAESRSLWEANLNAHYIFDITQTIGVYPVAGLNYSSEKSSGLGSDISESAFGLNLGAGLHYVRADWVFFSEYKYIVSHLSQSVYTLGVAYVFR